MSDTELRGDGDIRASDDGTTPDAEITPSNVDDPGTENPRADDPGVDDPGVGDPVGGAGAAEPSGVTPESGAWADTSPDGFEAD